MNLDDGDTGDLADQRQRVDERLALQKQIDKLIKQRREARPPACYRRTTIAVAIATVADWMAIAVHTSTLRTQDMSAVLGAHIGFGATLTGAAVILTVGWVMMADRIRCEAERDDLEHWYHRLRVLEVRSVAKKAAAAVRASGDAAAEEILEATQVDFSRRDIPRRGSMVPFRAGS